MRRPRSLFLCLVLAAPSILEAQAERRFEQLSTDDGLSQSSVRSILRDHRVLHTANQVEVPLSAYEERDWRARAGVALTPSWTLALSYLGHETQDAGRTDTAGRGDVRRYDNVDHFAWLDARYQGRSWLRRGRVALVYHRMEERAYRSNCATSDGPRPSLIHCALSPPVSAEPTSPRTSGLFATAMSAAYG